MKVPDDWLDRAYDLLVIGGGINGAAIARDAAVRGLRVLLVEGEDWGWGTSAKSSRLAHGGLRYLELLEFGLVHEALQDRERLLRQAPHLVRPLRFLYPLYPDVVARRSVRVGLFLYDLFSYGKSLPSREHLRRTEALQEAPYLSPEGLAGAAVYHDAQIRHVERLVMENVADAHAAGAVVINHTPVARLLVEDGRVTGAVLDVDDEQRPVRARLVINATGPWADVLTAPHRPERPPLIRRTKGSHIAVPRFLDDALLVRAQDGRVFFVVPWEDTCYIGTTDTDFEGEPADAAASPDDVAYLVDAARRYLPDAPLDEIKYTWSGVRALVNQEGLTESNVTRRHLVHDHSDEGLPGLLSLQGGKITTARTLAEEVVDRACRVLGDRSRSRQHPCRDRRYPGGPQEAWETYRPAAVAAATREGLDGPAAEHLVDTYGARWRDVLASDARPEARRLVQPDAPHLLVEVTWAVRKEQATTLADVMLRRTTLGLAPKGAPQAAKAVAAWMADLLGWGTLRRRRELAAYKEAVAVYDVPPVPALASG